MRFLILGANGQLGRAFMEALGDRAVGLGKRECDVSNLQDVLDAVSKFRPSVVINCAAYNRVDDAEKDPYSAFKVNHLGPRNVAFACKRYGAFFVHYSTDYVFDGKKETLYTEEDVPNPLNTYGKSKLFGERAVLEELGEAERFLLFRVSWVYGKGKQNFISKLLSWAEGRDRLFVSCDEFSVPTSTRVIVEGTLKSLDAGLFGVYHLVCSGFASRYEWAKKVFVLLNRKVFLRPVHRSFFSLPAERPPFSAMSNELLCSKLSTSFPNWEEELERFLPICLSL